MNADQFLTEAVRLETAARLLGFSPSVIGPINTAIGQAINEKRQMDCPHTHVHTWGHTHAGGRDNVTTCNECGKELSRKEA